jgi:hypothetical protein
VEQKAALIGFAKRMSGDLLQDVVAVQTRPVKIEVANNNIHSMRVKLTAGELAQIETRPLVETDQICRHEEVWYSPLTNVDHAMPAFAAENKYTGMDLGTRWSSQKRSAFVGTFHLSE